MIRAHNNLSEDIRVEQTHDRSGQPDKHTIERQDAPEVHREITMLNTDNELTRDIIEEDIDFKIPGLPHSIVKQLHSASVRELIQKIENHPHRHALQRDLQQSRSFNPFSQESKQMIHEVGNIELCELLDMEPKAGLLAKRNRGEQEIRSRHSRSLLDSQLLHKERATPRAPLREEARGQRILHRQFAQEEVQKEELLGCPRPVHPRREVPQEHV